VESHSFTLRLKTARYSKEIQEKIIFFEYELPSRWEEKGPIKYQKPITGCPGIISSSRNSPRLQMTLLSLNDTL
jgi:hypothetical protein